MKSSILYLLSLLATLALSRPVDEIAVARATTDLPRLVIYFQTTHDSNGNPISMLPLITEKNISLTHLIVCSFHLNLNYVVHLNDYLPSDPHFTTLWAETQVMKNASVKVMGMIGGAAGGSFSSSTLDSTNATTFAHYYGQLKDVITTYGLQGMDLDVEQSMSQSGITRLINQLYSDFGPDFLITLAPVASALENSSNLSGFDYKTLQSADGPDIAYNGQFYNGFGTLADTSTFDAIVNNGFSAQKVVAGQITSPSDGGGFVDFPTLNNMIIHDPSGTTAPWEWAQEMTAILRPTQSVNLNITPDIANMLKEAWVSSVINTGEGGTESVQVEPNVDYTAMVNA
ncbi:hypothetical protein G7Y89_g8389 [Cudoniella acicularis]|uniref:GH18 domain-containing protein n=1 Tax=Cudoniella acicularis TaxID=354080 RepID=A0A8H4RIZ4_9HELO|nr:hypothetical protein G7Y89_g8389 [Cudoniella acicularis]